MSDQSKVKRMRLHGSVAVLGMILVLGAYAEASQQPAGDRSSRTGRFDVREFGAVGNGNTLDTPAIEAAIQAANKAGGGTVVFLPGIYLTGTFRLLSNVTLDVEAGAVILGSANLSDYGSIEEFGFGRTQDISFNQVSFRFRVTREDVNAAVGGNFDLRWTTAGLRAAIFSHDIPGFYARYVRGLEINSLEILWEGTIPAYYSSALEFEDVEDLTVDRFRGRQATDASLFPVIALSRVDGVSIRNSTASEGASVFLATHQVTGERVFEGNDLTRARKVFSANSKFVATGNYYPSKRH